MHSLAVTLGRQALVLKEFKINQEGEEYVHMVARKAGLFAWLLTLLGIDATTVFSVFSNRVEFKEGTLSGEFNTVLPLRAVSIATCGYTRPFLLCVFGIVAILLCAFGMLNRMPGGLVFIFFLIAILNFVFYFLNKSLLISVISNSSWPISICFKRSVIEGVNIEYGQAQQVIQIINRLLMQEASK